MDLIDACALVGAGLAAGTVNAIAGGGSLITYPTLVALGLPPIEANVTNSVAVSPGYLASVYGSRAQLRRIPLHGPTPQSQLDPVDLLPITVIGAGAGCALLLITPERAFAVVVSLLILAAASVIAIQERIRDIVTARLSGPRHHNIARQISVGLAAIYGGYFGAALGVILVATLGLLSEDPLPRINAIKNVISAAVGIVTVAIFALLAPVNWLGVAVLAPASLIGGYLGARLAPRLPARRLRVAIVAIGLVVGGVMLVTSVAHQA